MSIKVLLKFFTPSMTWGLCLLPAALPQLASHRGAPSFYRGWSFGVRGRGRALVGAPTCLWPTALLWLNAGDRHLASSVGWWQLLSQGTMYPLCDSTCWLGRVQRVFFSPPDLSKAPQFQMPKVCIGFRLGDLCQADPAKLSWAFLVGGFVGNTNCTLLMATVSCRAESGASLVMLFAV